MNQRYSFLKYPYCAFDDLQTFQPNVEIDLVEKLVNSNFKDISVVEICSENKDSAKRLLSEFVELLEVGNDTGIYFRAEHLHYSLVNSNIEKFRTELQKYQYFLVDDMSYFIGRDDINESLKILIKEYVENGGKLIFISISERIPLKLDFVKTDITIFTTNSVGENQN